MSSSSPPQFSHSLPGLRPPSLAELTADRSVDQIIGLDCSNTFLSAKGVHIDPFGNVFSGTCSGIIAGNVTEEPLEKIWCKFNPAEAGFFGTLFEGGPGGLLNEAVDSGFKPKRWYASKCHLCTDLRAFFLKKGLYKKVVGPAECYGF